jgi:hypothetical protein
LQKRVNVSNAACDLAAPCADDPLGKPRVQLDAFDLDDGQPGFTTFFALYYAWSYCVSSPGSPTLHYWFAYRWSWLVHRDTAPFAISCVRSFQADYASPETNWPTIAWAMPYLFTTPPPPTLQVNPA